MEAGSIDISGVIKSLIQGVPMWGIILAIFGWWIHRMKEFRKEEKERWDRIEKDIFGIKISLASSGIADVKKNLDDLKKFEVEATLNMKALWKAIDPPKRRSDGVD